jgi:ElaA protein
MSDLISRRFDQLTVREFHDIARLRSEVFVVEQECVYLDLDGRDTAAEHHWIEVDGTIACYARTLGEAPNEPEAGPSVVRIGRVVTPRSRRGSGLAASLIEHLVARHGAGAIVLDAQSHLADWYARFGFDVTGAEYLEDGIPHVPMRRPPTRS